jgi:radical SAM-linked protein
VKVRFRFAKQGKVRFTSHRDVARMWERAFRRVQLPVSYSAGFSPRPKVSFGLALPTGAESVAEYLDVDLTEAVVIDGLAATLTAAMPVGVDVLAAGELEAGSGSLQQEVTSCTWSIDVGGLDLGQARARAAGVVAAAELVVTRERKGSPVTDDIRPAILSLAEPQPGSSGIRIDCELATQPRGLRPSELVEALGGGLLTAFRHAQWIERDGARWEPIPLPATDATHEKDATHDRSGPGLDRAHRDTRTPATGGAVDHPAVDHPAATVGSASFS